MKKILTSLLVSLLLFIPSFGEEDIAVSYEKNIPIGQEFLVDVSELETNLEENYGTNIFFEWDIKGASTKLGNTFSRTFESAGEKEINLTGYRLINGKKAQVYAQNIEPFVYTTLLPILYDFEISTQQKDNFINIARNSGIYLYSLGVYKSNDIAGDEIIERLTRYDELTGNKSDYIGVWGGKDFILNATGQVNKQILLGIYNKPLNIAIFSSFNKDVLEKLISNFLSEKNDIKNIIISDDATRFEILESPETLGALIENLEKNNHSFIEVDTNKQLASILFVSKFINNLSSIGFKVSDIYLIIIIPILLLGLSITKHIIGFSPLGIMIPIAITLLLFQVGIKITLLLLGVMFITNMILAKLMGRYTLLYTPKVSFLISINVIVIIGMMNILYHYGLLSLTIESIIFLILFILIAEKLITLIIGKEFREYKFSLLYTLAFSILSYMILNLNIIKIFILAYPEILILLIPINFFIGRFTGLRITEYLRFREVITSIEEEE